MEEHIEVQVSAILSAPRLGFTCAWHCIHTAIKGIPCAAYNGCWWERGIQEHLRDCLKKGVDFCVTFDYDSIFTEDDFDTLMQTIVNDDSIDAISGLQVRRGHGHALLTVRDKPGQPLEVAANMPLKVATAHFGLTIIRVAAMKDIPLPWLLNVPGEDGGWADDSPGRIDADIYFWKKLEEHGRSVYILPSIQIGHIEEVVATNDPVTGKAKHFYIADFPKASRLAVEVVPRKPKDEKDSK